MKPWSAEFEEMLLDELALCDQTSSLEPDTPLAHYGLTSLSTLALSSKLVSRYGIELPAFDERAFRTPRSLWKLVVGTKAAPANGITMSGTRIGPTDGLAGRFAEVARRHPDQPCLIDNTGAMTYAETAARAAAMAVAIGAGGVVAVLGEREITTYCAYLGVLYAGATIVPLSMDFPPDRNADIVRQAGARCVVHTEPRGEKPLEAQLTAMAGLPVVDASSANTSPATMIPGPVTTDTLAYLLFTSGSTGRPKGVRITHGNVAAFLTAALPAFSTGPGEVFSQCHGLTFDFSVFEMWGAWSTGSALAVVPRVHALNPAATIAKHGVTVWACTPSLIEASTAAGNLAPGSLSGLRHVVIGGEPLRGTTVALARAAAPNAIIDNVYGPTETTVWVSTYRLTPADPIPDHPILPIGSPTSGADIELSDDGELLVAGPQVFDGYADPSLNQDKLILKAGRTWYRTGDLAEWAGGVLHHRGRLDGQVKIRGYRVELGEIERTATRLLDGVRTAAARIPGDQGDAGLALFVEDTTVDEPGLRLALGRSLPAYMVPDRVIATETFPLNPHGKLDRAHLAQQCWSALERRSDPATDERP